MNFELRIHIFPPHHTRRPKCVKELKGRHSLVDTKFRIHKRLVLSLGKYRTNNFMNNQRLVKIPFP
jgi:hypothetical protein